MKWLSRSAQVFFAILAIVAVVHGWHAGGAVLAMGAFAPAGGLGQLNVALSEYMKGFPVDTGNIADQLAPIVPVTQRSFQYLITGREGQRAVPTLRAPGGRPQQIRMGWSTDKYATESHALEADITREAGDNALLLNYNLKMGATRNCLAGIRLDREIATATLFKTGITNTEAFTTGTTQWSDYTGASHPITDVAEAKFIIRKSGVAANVLALGTDVIKALTNHPDLIERFKYTNPTGSLTLDQISSALGIRCIEAGAIQVDGNNNPTFVWAQMAVMAYVQPVASQMDLSAAKTFLFSGHGLDGYQVLDYPDPYLSTEKDWVSASMNYDIKLTAQETVYTFTNVVAVS